MRMAPSSPEAGSRNRAHLLLSVGLGLLLVVALALAARGQSPWWAPASYGLMGLVLLTRRPGPGLVGAVLGVLALALATVRAIDLLLH